MSDGKPAVDWQNEFERFTGSTLKWDVLFPNYGGLRLVAKRGGAKVGELQFLYLHFSDCPLVMHNVSLRIANNPEIDQFRQLVQGSASLRKPMSRSILDPQSTLLAIASDGRTYFIWSMYLIVRTPGEELSAGEDWHMHGPVF